MQLTQLQVGCRVIEQNEDIRYGGLEFKQANAYERQIEVLNTVVYGEVADISEGSGRRGTDAQVRSVGPRADLI